MFSYAKILIPPVCTIKDINILQCFALGPKSFHYKPFTLHCYFTRLNFKKNGVTQILPSSVASNSLVPKTKIFFEILWGILEGRTNSPFWKIAKMALLTRAWNLKFLCVKLLVLNCYEYLMEVLTFSFECTNFLKRTSEKKITEPLLMKIEIWSRQSQKWTFVLKDLRRGLCDVFLKNYIPKIRTSIWERCT